jgi:hypothetical protein
VFNNSLTEIELDGAHLAHDVVQIYSWVPFSLLRTHTKTHIPSMLGICIYFHVLLLCLWLLFFVLFWFTLLEKVIFDEFELYNL